MPPKAAITRAMVEDAAFDIARSEGGDAITARRIAEHLKVSTQPIYTACGAIAAVRAAVAARAKTVAETYLRIGGGDGPPFLLAGYGALRFAHEEPHLFRLAGEAMRARLLDEPPPAVLAAMRSDPRLANLSEEQLRRIHALMWIFAQGLATLVGPQSPPNALDDAKAYLAMAGRAVVAWELDPVPKTD